MVKDQAPPEVTSSVADQVNILLVDDRNSNLLALQAILKPLGQNIVTASSGREALRQILMQEFAVILMDVQMPDLDGLETAALIRQREASKYIPIIFVTAVGADENRAYMGYSVGAVDYITKPFNSAMLVSKVGVFVDLFKKEKLLQEQTKQLHEKELDALQLRQMQREQQLEEEKIRSVNRMLEERVQERTAELEAFCYSISHDLRTPLRALDSYSAVLEDELQEGMTEAIDHSLKRIRSAARKMDEPICALLSLARITRAELHTASVNISEYASAIAQELRTSSIDRTIEVLIQDGMAAEADPDLVRSLLCNLLENSWKFTNTKESAFVEVGSFFNDAGQTVFFVKDNGVGFDQQFAHKLFQPFERLHSATSFDGNGIGLATVLRIVRKHGGSVWAEGEVGKGAQFFFTL